MPVSLVESHISPRSPRLHNFSHKDQIYRLNNRVTCEEHRAQSTVTLTKVTAEGSSMDPCLPFIWQSQRQIERIHVIPQTTAEFVSWNHIGKSLHFISNSNLLRCLLTLKREPLECLHKLLKSIQELMEALHDALFKPVAPSRSTTLSSRTTVPHSRPV